MDYSDEGTSAGGFLTHFYCIIKKFYINLFLNITTQVAVWVLLLDFKICEDWEGSI